MPTSADGGRRAADPHAAIDVELALKWSLGRGEMAEMPALLFDLLQAIRDRGSLARATRGLGVSYRSGWNLLHRWAGGLGQALVELEPGRGARLTALGEKLLWARGHAQSRLAPVLSDVAAQLVAELDVVTNKPASLVVFASHSLAQDTLRELVRRRAGVDLELHNHGSLESLRLFGEGHCDLAGFHIVEGELRKELARAYRPLLDARRHSLVRVAHRRQGLMLPPGNPRGLATLHDLARANVRFVNRQPGSGTRLLFDALLRRDGVGPASIRGYDTEEFTHSAVAALLASGAADAGFGVEAAAARFGLAFVPFADEAYYFAVRTADLRRPAVVGLVEVLAGTAFRESVRAMAGYDPRDAGRVESAAL